MAATASYIFDDSGIRALKVAAARLDAARVRVGVVGPEADTITPTGGQLRLWELAAIQEFGTQKTDHIPERSFIRSTLNDLLWVRSLAIKAVADVIFNKRSAEHALNVMGATIAAAMKNTIMRGVSPANAESTVRMKGHSFTLIGLTSTLLNAIGHEVVESSNDIGIEI